MRKPDFFIVGAGKAGTTALYHYLSQHPDVFMPTIKEPHYFCSDYHLQHPGTVFSRFTDEATYLTLFSDAGSKKRAGEASPTYLSSQVAAQNIYQFNPDAQIIMMLRSPIDTMYSAYHQFRFGQVEPLPTFEAAIAAQEDRRAGRQLPKNLRVSPAMLLYVDMVSYTAQIKRYFEYFPREQVHIIIFDDFKSDSAARFKEVLEFLEVSTNFTTAFTPVNTSKTYRIAWLQQLLYNPPSWLISLARTVEPVTKPIYHQLRKANMQEERYPPMQPETKRQLQEIFRPEVEALSALLGRDLTHWCQDL